MSPEKTKILQEKYPKIFGEKDNKEEPYGLYGLECGDGWFDLIDSLCKHIQHHVDWKIKNLPEEEREGFQVVATQIKEKFGSLRYYYDGGDDYIHGLVSMAEGMSSKICETCGEKATVRTNGWIKNICNSCHIKGNLKEKGFELK